MGFLRDPFVNPIFTFTLRVRCPEEQQALIHMAEFGSKPPLQYPSGMSSDRAPVASPPWQPHPDDDADIAEAMEAANRGDLLSPKASEAFVRWLEGTGDDSWRAELE